jgi:tRNA(fMet)-specific endonuclease VapC
VLIGVERRRAELLEQLGLLADEPIFVAAITASELLHGVHRAALPAQRVRREGFVEKLLGAIPVIPFDLLVARLHARLWAELAARGESVGQHDLLIAATALAHGHRVASLDQRSFPKIPGLTVLGW